MTEKKKKHGKGFEALIKLSAEEQGVDYTRLNDAPFQPQHGKVDKIRFTPRNICDCILYDRALLHFLEAKSYQDRMPFDALTQLPKLLKKWKPEQKIFSGVIIELRSRDGIRYFWISAADFESAKNSSLKKSINTSDAEELGIEVGLIIPKGKKNPRLNIKQMHEHIHRKHKAVPV